MLMLLPLHDGNGITNNRAHWQFAEHWQNYKLLTSPLISKSNNCFIYLHTMQAHRYRLRFTLLLRSGAAVSGVRQNVLLISENCRSARKFRFDSLIQQIAGKDVTRCKQRTHTTCKPADSGKNGFNGAVNTKRIREAASLVVGKPDSHL